MAGFFIEKLEAFGEGKMPSVITFTSGVNLIVGPSNTGKSYIINCFDYLFGYEQKKDKDPLLDPTTGYNHIKLTVRTSEGTVVFERHLGENKIALSGDDPNFTYKTYSIGHTAKYNINNIWLQLMGINEPHKILATVTGKKHQLTWRSMFHMFVLKQEHVTRPSSVLLNPSNPRGNAGTIAKAIVHFLMTGQDADDSIRFEDKKIINARRGAVIEYIKDTVARLALRESELVNEFRSFEATNVFSNYRIDDAQNEIDMVNREIDELQLTINSNIEQSKNLMGSIYKSNSQLAECDTLVDRFTALRSQYLSDIERLTFVVDGKLAHSVVPKLEHCPFCNSEMEASVEDPQYNDTVKGQLQHIRSHLAELEKAEKDLNKKRTSIINKIEELENKKRNIDSDLSIELKPRLYELKEKLSTYHQIVEFNKELEVVRKEEAVFNRELTEKETEKDPSQTKYNMNDYFNYELLHIFEEVLQSILRDINYEGAGSARINMNTFDLEVGGKGKSNSNGGGYCGLLNTIVGLGLVEFLNEHGKYSPGIFIADSPLTQLSESERIKEENTIKAGFLNHILSVHKNEESQPMQIIIAEHKEKLPKLESITKDVPNVNIIEFTGVKNHGRYGFLNDVFNYE